MTVGVNFPAARHEQQQVTAVAGLRSTEGSQVRHNLFQLFDPSLLNFTLKSNRVHNHSASTTYTYTYSSNGQE
jgi:hypothetical protein